MRYLEFCDCWQAALRTARLLFHQDVVSVRGADYPERPRPRRAGARVSDPDRP